ncbi:hypothetical protein AB0F46_41070 [Streptomyces sp. NPDC026665]|uniref:hypothetical protein n=1 Tax=Streptomyces sp. NPDC026665 TaxID=3154798 RepID=UPI0033D3FC69
MATAQLVQAASAREIASEEASALAALAHPLIAGALSVLAFTRAAYASPATSTSPATSPPSSSMGSAIGTARCTLCLPGHARCWPAPAPTTV